MSESISALYEEDFAQEQQRIFQLEASLKQQTAQLEADSERQSALFQEQLASFTATFERRLAMLRGNEEVENAPWNSWKLCFALLSLSTAIFSTYFLRKSSATYTLGAFTMLTTLCYGRYLFCSQRSRA